MIYDYILKGKKIVTLDDEQPAAKWVAVKDKYIVKVGIDEEIPEANKVLDFKDGIVLPGLMDSHIHGGLTAIMMSGVNLIEATSVDKVLSLIEERCRTTNEDFVIAPFFIQPQIKEGRYPTRTELDKISYGKKVMVCSITMHGSSINTAAYEVISFPEELDGLVMENGTFTGELASDEAHFIALSTLLAELPEQRYIQYIREIVQKCAEVGLTTVHCLEGQFVKDDKDLDLWIKLINNGELPIHCVVYPQVWNYEKVKKYDLPRHGGCLTLDGADLDHTMALNEPYEDMYALRGNLYHMDQEVYQLVSKAHRDGKQIAFHAMGDRAIDQIIYIYWRVITEQGDKKLRHRIEHFSMPTEEHVKLAAKLGLVVSPQPEFTYLFDTPGGALEQRFGVERAIRMEQYKVVSDAGVIVAGGSDAPVNSLSPLSGIHALVNAQREQRRFDVTGALKVYTQNVAYAAFEENVRGTIKEGYYADFTVLDQDPYSVPDKINEISVLATISEGNIVYRKKNEE